MDLKLAIETIPDLAAVEADLQVIATMSAYIADKSALKDALLEVKTMSKWTPATIKASCNNVMEVLGSVFEKIMTDFNDQTGASVDTISLKPFKARFDEEVNDEQANLKAAAMHVIEMASRVAMGLNIPVPASANPSQQGKPRKSFLKALSSLIVEEVPTKGKKGGKTIETPTAWLLEPILREDADAVQKLALMDQKLTKTGSPDALRAFAKKFGMSDADMAEVIIDVLNDARAQIAQSDSITAAITPQYNLIEKVVTTILSVRDETNATVAYVTGK